MAWTGKFYLYTSWEGRTRVKYLILCNLPPIMELLVGPICCNYWVSGLSS
jgi:hypothetical protein